VTNAGRVQNRVALIELMRELTVTRSTREWVTLLESAGVPCGPINTLADVFEDPQVTSRGMQIHMAHAARDDVALVASPIRMSDTPVQYRHAPPLLGQHTREVLGQMLDLKEETMNRLFEKGVLA
jgi:crotonobetainyl-CoA:carnitine CoA-transferase CaiB-like acyl-CoA transferase